MSHQQAFDITGALFMLDVIEIVYKGKAGLKSGKAAEFRYVLSKSSNGQAANSHR